MLLKIDNRILEMLIIWERAEEPSGAPTHQFFKSFPPISKKCIYLLPLEGMARQYFEHEFKKPH